CAVGGGGAADHDAAVGHGGVVAGQRVGVAERDGRVVGLEVVGHGDDGPFDLVGIGPVLEHDVALPHMRHGRCQVGSGPATDLVEGGIGGDRVLHPAGDTVDSAHRIRVTLAEAFAPERVGGTGGQDGLAVEAVDREHAGVPAGGDEPNGSALAGCRV